MNRASRRRANREAEKATRRYNYSMEELQREVKAAVDASSDMIREQARREATRDMLFLVQAIPSYVLAEDHWTKSANKKLPKFIDRVTEVFDMIQDGTMSKEELRDYVESLID